MLDVVPVQVTINKKIIKVLFKSDFIEINLGKSSNIKNLIKKQIPY